MDYLPNEIVTKILSYLSTADLLQFLKANENYSHFLREKHVIQFISFKSMFELSNNFDVCRFIKTNVAYNYIKVLDISRLYWIPVKDIQRMIPQLERLEELYAIDTKLGIAVKDICLYSKLIKLAVSVEASQVDKAPSNHYVNNLCGLKKLCLKINSKRENFEEVYYFLGAPKQLMELWIHDNNKQYGINYEKIVVNLPNLNKFIIKSSRPIPMLDFSGWGLIKICQNHRYDTAVEAIFERIPLLNKRERSIFCPVTPLERALEILQGLHCEMPWGPKEFEQAHFGKDMTDIYFEELNFYSVILECKIVHVKAALECLSAENSRNLKKLSFKTCLFQNPKKYCRPLPSTSFKRVRTGIPVETSDHHFQAIAENIKYLRELEVYCCLRCTGYLELAPYHHIGIFENLQKLTLEIPPIVDGSFLKEVFMKCQQLQSLRLTSVKSTEKFFINLCRNLQYANNLKDFRLEHSEIVIDNILSSFNKITNKKLLRIYIACNSSRYCGKENPFPEFLENNPQLVFFFLIVKTMPVREVNEIQKILYKFKKRNPANIFFIKKDVPEVFGGFPIPPAHEDMISKYTNVAVIDFNEFY